ncbi:glycosyltransferase family 2 protein [Planctomicrobium piriforme]|uniref:Glycosyltransferase, GT2 family n=1 Tax=Planctomicrobium piriforme TaxID=1576369 RepID=A0A1I3JA01_9PLAN|nr:glycosyltransferase [Planctomicrobium piriforme]SFI57039.1 Glycosyltransferase, GT2 family [Planctomicrobium piriforme]
MDNLPSVSVIIPQHGRPKLTLQAVSSLLRHSTGGTEIIVVDDGSPSDVLRSLQSQLDPSALLVRSNRRRGVTVSWNLGAAAATGDILVFLNNDTISHGPWIEQLLAPLQNGQARITGVEWRAELSLPVHWQRVIPASGLLAGWCLAMTRNTFHELGGFDERYRLYFSDTDLQLQALARWPNGLFAVAGLPLEHLGHASTRHWLRRGKEWQADHQKFLAKYGKEP